MDPLQTHWRTSSYTNPNNDNCVEVGLANTVVGIRDTKTRERGSLIVQRATFVALIHAVRQDQLTS